MKKTRIFPLLVIFILIMSSCSPSIKTARIDAGVPVPVTIGESKTVMSAPETIKENSKLVSDGDKVALYCNFEEMNISVLDKCTGKIWDSAVDKSKYESLMLNKIWERYMSSLVSIRVFNIKDKDLLVSRYSNLDRGNKTQIVLNGEKLTAEFLFDNQEITFSLDIWIENDVLCVMIDDARIKENGDYRIISIEVLPFFGAAEDNESGYTLVPDGSGTLIDFKSSNGQNDRENYNFYVYSLHSFEPDAYYDAYSNEKYSLSLPLFGVKCGDSAFLAHSTEGAEDAELTVSPSGNIVPFTRSAFKYYYRYTYNVPTTNIESDTGTAISGTTKHVTKIEEKRVNVNRRQEYIFLRNETADYSGMANAYQSYLIENKMIKDTVTNQMPLYIDLFCSVNKKQLLGDKLVKMTTFDDVEKIKNSLIKSGIDNIDFTLKGWAKGGYTEYVKSFLPEGSLGGKRTLNSLPSDKTRFYLYLEPFITNEKMPKRSSLVLMANKTPASYNNGKTHFYNHAAMIKNLESVSRGCGEFGFSLNSIGNVLIKNPTKGEMIKSVCGYLDEESKKRNISLSMPNEYALPYADRISKLPMKSSQYWFYDRDVPFYQMVLYGLLPYSSEPLNLSYDLAYSKLKLVEYGAVPYFELTAQNPVLLKDTAYQKLFTSSFDKWSKEVTSLTLELRKKLSGIWGNRMIKHEKLEEGVYKTVYSNGGVVYVNYNSEDRQVENQLVKANDYKVVVQ